MPLVDLNELFLWEETRKVDKTGCIRLDGNTYEVDSDLVRRTVTLRYDPFDLSELQVWDGEQQYADAVPVELNNKRSRKAAAAALDGVPETPADETLSFLALAERKRQAAWTTEELRFTGKGGDVR
ncbi:Mu transposase C-terminal domain-containing protein [Paenibacillus sp. PL2-23]|uniref:Mu transposase C-terminal domain-containing protein n=1 Tax=Paenibacillus sp. PL2-23 TaxID=2100729 RepID=UPI0030F8277A